MDLLKDEAKAKFGRYKAGDHTMTVDYAVNFEWSVRLVGRLVQGEVITEYAPPGLLQVKQEPWVFTKRLSSGSSTALIDLCSPQKKNKTDEQEETDPRDFDC